MKRECGNCGAGFIPAGDADSFCMPCELAIKAMEPPEHLKDMRWVYAGNAPRTPSELQMKTLLDQDVGRFVDRLTRFDDQYRAAVAKRAPEKKVVEAPAWDGKGPCPTCKRAAVIADASVMACLQKAERWLKDRSEAGVDAP